MFTSFVLTGSHGKQNKLHTGNHGRITLPGVITFKSKVQLVFE